MARCSESPSRVRQTNEPDNCAPQIASEVLGGGKVDIHERTFAFAVRVLKLAQVLPTDTVGRTVARQIARSGTSVGANVEEAQGSHSKAEFARRMGIARSEARETLYWLRLIPAVGMIPAKRIEDLSDEAEQIAKILTSIVKKTRQ